MYAYIEPYLQYEIAGNTVLRYLAALAVFLGGMAVVYLVIHRIVKKLKILAEKSATSFDDFLVSVLERIVLPLLYLVALYAGLKTLAFPETVEKVLNFAILGALLFFTVRSAMAFIGYGFAIYLKRQGGDIALGKSLHGIMGLIRILLWAAAVVFFLDNLGFKISAVIAGLGIGGVAVALAAQAVLKDLFSYFCILFDHPFKVGDFIIVGEFLGTIEHIGIKTTRIRSLGGEMLVFSNSDLTDSRLRNYKLMERRRVVFKLGVVYQTPADKVKEIPGIIKAVITGVEDTVFDRAHFLSFGDFSLVYEVVYYVIGGDYNKYMDIQQKINFGIMDEFAKRSIEFAYPTQTVFLSREAS